MIKMIQSLIASRDYKRVLAELKPQLSQLRKDIDLVTSLQSLDGIVKYFIVLAPWSEEKINSVLIRAHDSALLAAQPDIQVQTLKQLLSIFDDAKGTDYGMNRTRRDESVSAHSIYLGGINGLFTKTVFFWKNRQCDKKGGWGKGSAAMEMMNAYDIVSLQAQEYVNRNVLQLKKALDTLCHEA